MLITCVRQQTCPATGGLRRGKHSTGMGAWGAKSPGQPVEAWPCIALAVIGEYVKRICNAVHRGGEAGGARLPSRGAGGQSVQAFGVAPQAR